MAESFLWTLVFFVYVVTVALSPVLALGIVILSRRQSTTAALGAIVGAVAGIVTLGATVGFAVLSWQAGIVLFLAGQGALLGLDLIPLLVGRGIVRQGMGVDREAALRVAVTAWPLALAGSFALFVAPGGFARYNITDLSRGAAVLAGLAWVAFVLVGPGLLGSAGVALRRRL